MKPSGRPCRFVMGLGRCGSSAMMHALLSAEVPVCGEPPYYEVPVRKADAAELRASAQDYVLKVIWPHLVPEVVAGGGKTVFLARRAFPQALSMAQLLYDIGMAPTAERDIAALARELPHDEARALAALRDAGHDILRLDFADMTGDPVGTMRLVLNHFEIEHTDIRVFMGAAGIKRRSDESDSWNFYRGTPRYEHSSVARAASARFAP